MDDIWIVYGLISCMGISRISVDIISSNCHITDDAARAIIKEAKQRKYIECNKSLETEMPLVYNSNQIHEFDLDKVCVVNNFYLDGSGLVNVSE